MFYSQVYEALFESHDLSKDISFVRPKYSNLDSSEFHHLLRRLGFWCLRNGGKIEFQKDQLEIVIQEIISSTSGINTSAVNFVKDLSTTVPLFVKEGSSLRWSHKSLMEYFASMFICNDAKGKQGDIFLYFYNSNDWASYKNIFELCADIDFTSLRASVIKEVLGNYIEFHDSNYQRIINKKIKLEDIENRVGLSFGRMFGFRINSMAPRAAFNFSNDEFFDENNKDVTALLDENQYTSREINQSITLYGGNIVVYEMVILSRDNMIVQILKYKLPHIFCDINELHSSSLIKDVMKSSIKKNKFYIVSDSPTAIINNSKNFRLINFLMLRSGGVSLDYIKVKSEFDMIIEDSSNGIDKLVGDLC